MRKIFHRFLARKFEKQHDENAAVLQPELAEELVQFKAALQSRAKKICRTKTEMTIHTAPQCPATSEFSCVRFVTDNGVREKAPLIARS